MIPMCSWRATCCGTPSWRADHPGRAGCHGRAGPTQGQAGSYKQWEEGNVAPQVVFETLSPGNRPPEMERKFKFYEQFGVEEYYIYDPDDGTFEGWLRRGSRLAKVEKVFGFVSPRLQIRFEPGEGPDNLKIFGPDGEPFQTLSEVVDQRNAAEKVAVAERQRADRLAAKLRDLGFEPD